MIDLYHLIAFLAAILSLLTLLCLKYALKDTSTLIRFECTNKQKLAIQNIQKDENGKVRQTIKYMLTNWTIAELVAVRRAKGKLPLLASINITLICAFFSPSPFTYCFVGSLIMIICLLFELVITQRKNGEQQKDESDATVSKQKFIDVALTIASVLSSLVLIGCTFKNYKNSVLSLFLENSVLNIVLDHFLIKPLTAIILSLPMSQSQTVQNLILRSSLYEQVLNKTIKIHNKESESNHPNLLNLINKRIPLEIEPQPISHEQKTHQILKKLKKERLAPLRTPEKAVDDLDYSNNSLNGSKRKEETSPKRHINQSDLYGLENFPKRKGQSFVSQNLILINPSRDQQQNAEEIDLDKRIEESNEKQSNQQSIIDDIKKETIVTDRESRERNLDPMRIRLIDNDPEKLLPLRIQIDNQEEEGHEYMTYRRNSINIQGELTCKNTVGVLEIKKNNEQCEDIEEVDLNSPQKRKRIEKKLQQSHYEIGKKKKLKKLSIDSKQRVIKFSTGEPYLQYLPNMLNKDKTKKSQLPLSKRDIIIDSRVARTVKRPKKKDFCLENNENMFPELRIDEL